MITIAKQAWAWVVGVITWRKLRARLAYTKRTVLEQERRKEQMHKDLTTDTMTFKVDLPSGNFYFTMPRVVVDKILEQENAERTPGSE